jgi:tungstate transport system substrate-binding protein
MLREIHALLSLLILLALLFSACAPAAPQPAEPPAVEQPTNAPEPTPTAAPLPAEAKLILATTTSTQDSGLLDVILPDFEAGFGVKVDVIAVGTGQALQLGQDGNADVLLVHSRACEDEFMANKHGVRREDVMYNNFVIVGPESDPAGIKGLASAAEAFQKIAAASATFISRGDDSGTHTKELSIWKTAAIEPAGAWYVSAGQGMGEVLTMSNEQQAYTLSDRATYLARSKAGLELVILVEGDQALFNPYGVIAVNPEKNPAIRNDLAEQFIDWIISIETQEKIAEFGKADFGQSLFIPASTPWKEARGSPAAEPPPEAAAGVALKITGKVTQEMAWTEAQVKALPSLDVQSTNRQGQMETYTGVLIAELLRLAAPAADAAAVVFVADDGSTAEAPLADLLACTDCILSFRSKGGFSSVLPGQPGSLQVKGVIELQVK